MLSSPVATISQQRLVSPHEDVRRRYAQATDTSSQVPPYRASTSTIIPLTISGASTRTQSSPVGISGPARVGFASPNKATRISPSYGHPEPMEPVGPVACSIGTLKGKTRCLQSSEDCSGTSQTTVRIPYSQNMPLEYPPIVPATIPRPCSTIPAQVPSTSTDTATRPNVSPLATRSTVLEQYSQLLHRANTRPAPSMVETEAAVRRFPPTAIDLPQVSVSSRTLISPATTRPPVAPEAGPSAPFRSTRSTTLGLWSRMNSRNYIVQSGPPMASRPDAGPSNAVHCTPESYDESPEDYSPSSIVSEPPPEVESSMLDESVEATATPRDCDYTPPDSPARTTSSQPYIASYQRNEVERVSQDSTPVEAAFELNDYTPFDSPARTPSPQPYIVSEQRRGVVFQVTGRSLIVEATPAPEDQFNVDEEITFVESPRTPVEITWGGTAPGSEDYDGPFEEYVSEAVVQARDVDELAEFLVAGYNDEEGVEHVPYAPEELVAEAYDGSFEASVQVREVEEAVDHIPYAEEELGMEGYDSPLEEVAAESVEYEGPFEGAYVAEAVVEEAKIVDYDPFESVRRDISYAVVLSLLVLYVTYCL